jgi:hypothetical protein
MVGTNKWNSYLEKQTMGLVAPEIPKEPTSRRKKKETAGMKVHSKKRGPLRSSRGGLASGK